AARGPTQGGALRRRPALEHGDQRVEPRGHDALVQRERRDDRLGEGRLRHPEGPGRMSDNHFDYPAMARALILGDKDTVARKTREGLELSMDPKDLIFRGLIPGMDVVGEKFRRNEYYVPQVLLSARAMYAGLDLLKPLITAAAKGGDYHGIVAIGTARGVLHDIGKNLVAKIGRASCRERG